jgi:hypothetical protein
MFATLSAEARIQAGLNELAANDLTTGRLAEYTGNIVSQTRLSLALSGTKALENSHGTLKGPSPKCAPISNHAAERHPS